MLSVQAFLLAVMIPAATAQSDPACRAELRGGLLITSIDFGNGYLVQAPWRVIHTDRTVSEDNGTSVVMDAMLDRIVEIDAITGQASAIPLDGLVTISFTAPTEPELVYQAGQTWCNTVMAVGGSTLHHLTPAPKGSRIA